MECTNKNCKNEATKFVQFEMLTDLGLKINCEHLCEHCAIEVLSWGLAYRKRNKFKLIRFIPIEEEGVILSDSL